MKRFFLLIFVVFSSLIFYQIVLGKNGIIEGYRVQKEKEKLIYYKSLLKEQKKEYAEYIKYLKKNPDALKPFAESLGFFKDNLKLIKILDDTKTENSVVPNDHLEKEIGTNKLLENVEKSNKLDKRIQKIRIWLSVFFYLFFGLFIILIIFGIEKNKWVE